LLEETLYTRLHKALGRLSVSQSYFEKVDDCRTNLLVGLHHPGAIHWNQLCRKRKRQNMPVPGIELIIVPHTSFCSTKQLF
jgi:hypothetical protein